MKPSYERTSARNMTRQKLWADIYTGLMVQRTALTLPMQQGEAERAANLALASFDQRFPEPLEDPDHRDRPCLAAQLIAQDREGR